jgi:hypothetical protein
VKININISNGINGVIIMAWRNGNINGGESKALISKKKTIDEEEAI